MYQYALLGHNLTHSISPFIHNLLFKINDIDAKYELLDIAPENLKQNINILSELDGYNVTIPYKTQIGEYLDELSINSALSGSVNTVKNTEISIGYTSDYEALMDISNDVDFSSKNLILGYGGVAKAIILACINSNAESITLAIRENSKANAEKVVDDIKRNLNFYINLIDINKIDIDFDTLINATPVGMYPNTENCPVSLDVIKKAKSVFDTIYNPQRTQLIKLAKELNIKAISGLKMLVYQAAHSQKIWLAVDFDDKDLEKVILESEKELERIYG